MQNKLHWAIHGHTAAEVVQKRADASKPNMGLTTWKNAPKGRSARPTCAIAKNYLTEEELVGPEPGRHDVPRLRRGAGAASPDRCTWPTGCGKLDGFLQFNERNILTHFGKVTHKLAEEHAHREFDKYEAERRRIEASQPTSDFDQAVEEVKRLEAEQKAIEEKKTPPSPKTPKRKKPKE